MDPKTSPFSREERKTLHSLAEMFQDKDDRDELRSILANGATLKQLVNAYRTQKGVVSFLKAAAGLIIVLGGAYGVIKGFGGSFKG